MVYDKKHIHKIKRVKLHLPKVIYKYIEPTNEQELEMDRVWNKIFDAIYKKIKNR